MRCGIFVLIAILLFSCKKEEINLQEELQEGAWQFLKVENTNDNVLLDGTGEPMILLFFLDDNVLKGRLSGSYSLNGQSLFLQAEIDSLVINSWTPNGYVYDELDHFPQRYYDFEAITKKGIEGKVEFIENGFDSQFYIQYEVDKRMWFQRY